MRTASKLLLLCATAIVAMAFTASSASATNAVTVTNETENGAACSPCNILVEGESTISVESTMTPVSFCEDTFEAAIGSNGQGAVTTLTNANHSGQGCITEKCDGEGGEPETETQWPFSIERDGVNSYGLHITFCLDVKPAEPAAQGGHCELNATLAEEALDEHDYNIAATNAHCPLINRIVNGTWEIHDDLLHPGSQPHESIEIQ
jgi:hypothetical protein